MEALRIIDDIAYRNMRRGMKWKRGEGTLMFELMVLAEVFEGAVSATAPWNHYKLNLST